MSNLFANLDTDETIAEEKDSLRGGGFTPMDSAAYDMTIKYAYMSKSINGATAMNLVLTSKDGKEVKDQQWIASGDAKGNKNYYMKRDKDKKETGEKAYLPGFSSINSLCLLATGKTIAVLAQTTIEEKTISLYSFDAKGEVPTKVDMIMGLVGQVVTAGVLHQIVDKTKKNDSTEKYEPTGEVRKVNTVDKYFRQSDGLTVAEIKAKATEPKFKQAWEDKWNGVIDDQSVGTSTGGTSGSPAASGSAAPKENLFA